MCRILLVKSKVAIDPQSILEKFAKMCQKSRAMDGDWQGDGWGFSYLDENKKWQTYKSLRPIWDEYEVGHKEFPKSKIFIAHARSASFPKERGFIEFNQPYFDSEHAFVGNLSLKGVKMTKAIKGKHGAEKVWYLNKENLDKGANLAESLKTVRDLMKKSAREILQFNIGIASNHSISALCLFDEGEERFNNYATVHYHSTPELSIICSEPLQGYDFKDFKNGEVKEF